MRPINKTAQRTFDQLVAGLAPGESRILDTAPGCYMAMHVERLTADRYSLAHYFEQNGDLVADPDGEFWIDADCRAYLVALQQSVGCYTRAVEFGPDGQPSGIRPRACRELASFAAMWLRNVKAQQLAA